MLKKAGSRVIREGRGRRINALIKGIRASERQRPPSFFVWPTRIADRDRCLTILEPLQASAISMSKPEY